jgi:hypothetical protein
MGFECLDKISASHFGLECFRNSLISFFRSRDGAPPPQRHPAAAAEMVVAHRGTPPRGIMSVTVFAIIILSVLDFSKMVLLYFFIVAVDFFIYI